MTQEVLPEKKVPHWAGLTLEAIIRLSSKISIRKSEIVSVYFFNGKRFILENAESGKGGIDVIKRYVKDTDKWQRVGWHRNIPEAIQAIRTGKYNDDCRDDKEVAV